MIRYFSASFTTLLLMLDVVSALIAVFVASKLRTTINLGVSAPIEAFATPWWFYVIIPIMWIIILNNVGAYAPARTYRIVLESLNLFQALIIAVFVFSGFVYVTHRDFSRVQLLYIILLTWGFTFGYRVAMRAYFRISGGRSYDSKRVLVLGTGALAQSTGLNIRSYAWTGLYLVGFIEVDEKNTSNNTLEVIGQLSQLNDIVDEFLADELILAIENPPSTLLHEVTTQMYQKNVKVRLVPDLQGITYLFPRVEDLNGLPLISLRDTVLSPQQWVVKRLLDIVVSGLILAMLWPIMIIVAIVIMLDSPGSPIYAQERVGKGQKIFKMYKFRSMVKNADQLQEQVNQYDTEGHLIHKSKSDPRITKIGRFLRRSSLDELPQFFNILKGDMSLVGPRPEMPWMLAQYQDWQLKRFEVPQGLTGWWQINSRSETPMYMNTEDDLHYILNYSLLMDVRILLWTPMAVFRGNGSF